MTESSSDLARIAAALERLAPPPSASADPAAHPAYVWRDGALAAARAFAPLPLALLTGIDAQKAAVLENTRRLASGHAAHDVLLWGSRGMGKSALVKSVVGALRDEGADLALIEVAGDRIGTLPALFDAIANVPRAFAIFIDDLGFEDAGGADPRVLRSLLEGGAEARPANARLHVTSNRRHIVARAMEEQQSAINPRDVVDDRLALADRFGLNLGFHNCDQDTYLSMVGAYADRHGLALDAADALLWAQQRGSRSGRIAWQYAVELAGRAGKSLGGD
ncbi:ATP-binding protein [Sphingomonas colocasiae]|uniref:ATP-binding protein n=1 Tax=Sphingomonas colocasiae TaxID=1848973 RepID=A0ABS7PSF4_9SPHN|nr:ATP-binding protein [Sphingomonas colocasiae]MBY8824272.1 ATP-binding protein [Sphingomonas colocasiae]